MPPINPDQIGLLLTVVGAAGSTLAAIVAAAWRIGTWASRAVAAQAALGDTVKALQDEVRGLSLRVEKVASLAVDTRSQVKELKALAIEREKDVARLEGRLDQSTRVTMELTGAVKEAAGSLGALWRTLQTLHPDQVPRRASDRG